MSETIVVALIVAIPAFVASLAALIVSIKGNREVAKLTVVVNGRLTQLLKSVGTENQATGHAAGVESERVRAKTHHD
jgi:hypothetical protein